MLWMVVAAVCVSGLLTALWVFGVIRPGMKVRAVSATVLHPSQSFTLLNASGYVEAQRKAAVGTKITGRLVELLVEEGSRVATGQVLARLENDDALAARARSLAEVDAAKSEISRAKAVLVQARADHARYQELRRSGVVSQGEFDAVKAAFQTAQAVENAARAGLRARQAALAEAEVAVGYSLIKAPFAGVVLTKDADVGDIITPLGAADNARAAVVTMADMGSLQVEADVSESSIGQVRVGQPCVIQLDALAGDRFQGRVHMVVPTADRSKASVLVKVAFLDADPRVLPEMSAKVAFLEREVKPEEERPVIAVPAVAVAGMGDEARVYVIEQDTARARRVSVGRAFQEMVEIRSGLTAGERLVLGPMAGIRDGARVEIQE